MSTYVPRGLTGIMWQKLTTRRHKQCRFYSLDCFQGRVEIVNLLTNAKADVNSKDNDGPSHSTTSMHSGLFEVFLLLETFFLSGFVISARTQNR